MAKQGQLPLISVIIPVHNQQEIIIKNISSIIKNMSLPFELIVIDDYSDDNTRTLLDEFFFGLKGEQFPLIVSIKYFSTNIPIFETKADTYGIQNASGEYILEVQADMKILEKDFDQKMLNLLKSGNNIFAISARGVHSFGDLSADYLISQTSPKFSLQQLLRNTIIHKKVKLRRMLLNDKKTKIHSEEELDLTRIFPEPREFETLKRAGWLGRAINALPESLNKDLSKSLQTQDKKLWVGDTIMRGPLIFKKSDYLDIGGFEVKSFFLGNDDHCLCFKAKRNGKIVAFTPVHFTAPLNNGSERAHKTFRSLFWRELHRLARADNLRRSEFLKYLRTELKNGTTQI